MPAYLNKMDSLTAKMSGAQVEPRRETPVERVVRDHCKAITESMGRCCSAMLKCVETMAEQQTAKPIDEEWDIIVTSRDGPYIQRAKIKRVR